MYATVALGMLFVIIRAVYLHNSHIKPTLVARLANYNLLTLVRDSYDVYHSAAVWLIFTWVANTVIIINAIAGQSFSWVAVIATFISIVSTLVLFQDVYKEIENIRRKPSDYQWV